MSYEAPQLTVHGPIQSLTLQLRGAQCPKQLGLADLIQGQISLGTCTPTSV